MLKYYLKQKLYLQMDICTIKMKRSQCKYVHLKIHRTPQIMFQNLTVIL